MDLTNDPVVEDLDNDLVRSILWIWQTIRRDRAFGYLVWMNIDLDKIWNGFKTSYRLEAVANFTNDLERSRIWLGKGLDFGLKNVAIDGFMDLGNSKHGFLSQNLF